MHDNVNLTSCPSLFYGINPLQLFKKFHNLIMLIFINLVNSMS